jgi:hypothetical protein
MDLEQIEEKKARLERNIGYLVNSFEEETETEVDNIFVGYRSQSGQSVKITSRVKIKDN